MSEALSALRAPIDPGQGGILLANMLESWLDHDRSSTATAVSSCSRGEKGRGSPEE